MHYAFIKFGPMVDSEAVSRKNIPEAERRDEADYAVRKGLLGEGHIALVKVNGPVLMIVDEWDMTEQTDFAVSKPITNQKGETKR